MAFDTIGVVTSAVERTLSLKNVPEGVCRLTLFNRFGQVLAVRSLYIRGNIKAPSITFTADKSYYEPFEKMNISFKLTDSNGQRFETGFVCRYVIYQVWPMLTVMIFELIYSCRLI